MTDGYVGETFFCPTEKLANEFLKLVYEQGWRGVMGDSLIEESYYDKYKECKCYYLNRNKYITCGNIAQYESYDKQIIEFEGEKENE